MGPTSRKLCIIILFLAPLLAGADVLVNINTADLTTLETLPGIGATYGQRIIDYRGQNGPFATIEDIENVSGIGPATFAKIENYITVGDEQASSQTQTQTETQTQSQTSSTTVATSSQDTESYDSALPPGISAQITLEGIAIAGGGATFDGAAFDQAGDALLSGVQYLWNFGDGATAEGQRAQHTYAYPGRYVIELTVSYTYSSAEAQLVIQAAQPAVALLDEADGSLTILDESTSDLDVGGWALTDGAHTFYIPAATMVLASGGLRFASGVTGVVGGENDVLLYPNGTRAANAAPSADSPLRGEPVAPAQTVSRPPSPAPAQPLGMAAQQSAPATSATDSPQIQNTIEEPEQTAAAASARAAVPLWAALLGLVGLAALGGGAAWYLRASSAKVVETQAPEEEFDIK